MHKVVTSQQIRENAIREIDIVGIVSIGIDAFGKKDVDPLD